VSKTSVRVLVWVCGIAFVLSARQLNHLTFILSPLALAVVLAYPT
jgi:4-hydroxybenzoate polyprenyltransferase